MLKNFLPLGAVMLVLLASCAKEGPTGPTGLAGPSLSGSISGHVKLYDMYGSNVLTGLSSVKLVLNSSATAVYPDVYGYFQITSLNNVQLLTGNYTLAATDSTYGATIKNNIQLVTGALNVDMKLSAIPDSFVYSFNAYHPAGAAYDSLVMTCKPDTRLRYSIVFADTLPGVSSQPANYIWSKVLSISPAAPAVALTVPAQDLYDLGLVSGKKIYYIVYSYVVGDVSVYEDVVSGRNVYNAVSGPHIDSTLVP